MQTYVQTFAGATTWQLNIAGSYFVTLQCTNAINVRLYRGGKKLDLGDMSGLLAGLEIGPLPPMDGFPFAFDRVEIDVTGADTIKVGVGNGQARYNRSNGTVDVNSFAAAAAAVLQRPEAQTNSFADTSVLLANTPIAIFTPGANVNGAIVFSAYSTEVITVAGIAVFIAKSSAPASVVDGAVILQGLCYGGVNATVCGVLPEKQFIPAGLGLYYIASAALGASAYNIRSARYKLL